MLAPKGVRKTRAAGLLHEVDNSLGQTIVKEEWPDFSHKITGRQLPRLVKAAVPDTEAHSATDGLAPLRYLVFALPLYSHICPQPASLATQ